MPKKKKSKKKKVANSQKAIAAIYQLLHETGRSITALGIELGRDRSDLGKMLHNKIAFWPDLFELIEHVTGYVITAEAGLVSKPKRSAQDESVVKTRSEELKRQAIKKFCEYWEEVAAQMIMLSRAAATLETQQLGYKYVIREITEISGVSADDVESVFAAIVAIEHNLAERQ